jgi:hypothetical protein
MCSVMAIRVGADQLQQTGVSTSVLNCRLRHALDELAGAIGLFPMQRGFTLQTLGLELVPLRGALKLHYCFVDRLFSHSKSPDWFVIISAGVGLKIKSELQPGIIEMITALYDEPVEEQV